MLINQNFNNFYKLLSLEVIRGALNSAKRNRVFWVSRFAFALFLVFSSSKVMMAAPRDNQGNSDEATKSQQVDSSKPSSEAMGVNIDDNIRLRRALDEYSRTVDPAHVQIEERRRVMHARLQERFSQTDRDNDGTISLEEAYDTMPQLARHFGAVDLNGDRLITMDELEALQARIAERQRIATVKAEVQETDSPKSKAKGNISNSRKNAL